MAPLDSNIQGVAVLSVVGQERRDGTAQAIDNITTVRGVLPVPAFSQFLYKFVLTGKGPLQCTFISNFNFW